MAISKSAWMGAFLGVAMIAVLNRVDVTRRLING